MTAKLSSCVKAATTLNDQDLSALTDAIEAYQRAGVAPAQAEALAVDDMIAAVTAERKEMVTALREQHPDAFESDKPAPTAAQRARARMAFNPETDSVLQAIAKMGGLRRDIAASEFGLKPEELKHTVATGGLKGYPFRATGGMDLDRVLTNLQEAGYFPGVADEDARGALEAAIFDELGGGKNLTVEGQMRAAQEAVAEKLDADEAAEREALLADAEMLDDIPALTDDDVDFFATSNTSTEAAMRALGFSEEEIRNETAREAAPAGAPEDGQAAAEEATAPGRARSEGAGSAGAGSDGFTLARQSADDLKAKTAREADADALDERAQIDAERDMFGLQQQTGEQRSDSTSDMFGGPTADDVRRAAKPKGKAPTGPDLFAQPDETTPSVQPPSGLDVSNADERAAIESPDDWDTTKAPPTDAEILAAGKIVKPGLFLQTNYGFMKAGEVIAVTSEPAKDGEDAITQVRIRNMRRPRKENDSFANVFLRDGKLYEVQKNEFGRGTGHDRVYVLDKALPTPDPEAQRDWENASPDEIGDEISRLHNEANRLMKAQLSMERDSDERAETIARADDLKRQADKLNKLLPDEETTETAADDETDEPFEPPTNWRESMYGARVYAKELGIDPAGMELPALVKAIDKKIKPARQAVDKQLAASDLPAYLRAQIPRVLGDFHGKLTIDRLLGNLGDPNNPGHLISGLAAGKIIDELVANGTLVRKFKSVMLPTPDSTNAPRVKNAEGREYREGDGVSVHYDEKSDEYPRGFERTGRIVKIEGDKVTFKPNGAKEIVIGPDRLRANLSETLDRGGPFGGTVREPDAPYTTDLFGNELPEPARKPAPAQPAAARVRGDVQPAATVSDTPAPAGRYFARTIVGAEVQRKLGTSRIVTAADAAAATRYLYKSAVERFDGIVTDKDGKPLAVIGGFKGAINQASVYPSTLMGEAVRIKGAAKVWFSHNHPSGEPALSRADEHLSAALVRVFQGSGIESQGLLAIGNGQFSHVNVNGLASEPRAIPEGGGDVTVPVIERTIARPPDPESITLNSPADAKRAAHGLYEQAGNTPGMVLLDSQHKVLGWVPLPDDLRGLLRGTGGLNALYRAVSEANAGAALLVHGGELDVRVPGGGSASMNIAAALEAIDVRPLDSLNMRTGTSAAEQGMPIAGRVALDFQDTELLPRPDVTEGEVSQQDADAVAKLQSAFRGKVDAFQSLKLTALPRREETGERRAAVELTEKLFGRRLVFFHSNMMFANGMVADYLPGMVFVNENTSRPVMAVIGHELVHSMRQSNPELYAKLGDRLRALLEEPGRYGELLNAKRATRGLPALSFDKLREELIADIVGDNFTDPVFWRQVSKGQPSLFGRVLRVIRDFFDDLLAKLRNERPYGTSQYLNDVQAARDAVAAVMSEFGASPKTAAAAVTTAAGADLSEADPVDSAAFKRWFGDSKVVTQRGDPMVVYHGAPDARFANDDGIFKTLNERYGYRGSNEDAKRAFFFTDSRRAATTYADDRRAFDYQNADPGVIATYLSIKNPLVIEAGGRHWREAQQRGKEDVIAEAKAAGHDGVIIRNVLDDYNHTKGGSRPIDVFVAFSSNQIKSVNNSGAFDPNNPDIRASENNDPFYSELARQIQTAKMGAAPAQGWKDYLKGLTNKGVKADEIAWTGIEDWLDLQTGKVTRDAIVDYLDSNGVKVTETTLGSSPNIDAVRDQYMKAMVAEGATASSADQMFREMLAFARDHDYSTALSDRGFELVMKHGGLTGNEIHDAVNGADPTKYGTYTLPGGSNYREVLLTLPNEADQRRAELSAFQAEMRAKYPDAGLNWGKEATQAERDKANRLADSSTLRATYQSGHWDQRDVLAHIRLNDRTDADGKRVLFVEEIQSDWAQQGKKSGFVGEPGVLPEGWSVHEDPKHKERNTAAWYVIDNNNTQVGLYMNTRQEAIDAATDRRTLGVPRAPFVGKTDAWVALAIKRVIKMAVDEGYDRVAFVNGEQSAERYSLAKQVDRMTVYGRTDAATRKPAGRAVNIDLANMRGAITIGVNDKGVIDNVRANAAGGDLMGKPLEDVIGKEMAERVMNAELGMGGTEFSGEGLKVGGEGMKAFYDKIVPSVAKDVVRKLGGQLAEMTVANPDARRDVIAQQVPGSHLWSLWDNRIGRWINEDGETLSSPDDGRMSERAARAMADGFSREGAKGDYQQLGFDITPSMREKAAGGLPMFSLQYTPEEEEALRKAGINTRTRLQRAGDRIRTYYGNAQNAVRSSWARQFQQGALDQFTGLNLAVRREIGALPVDQDPYVAARLANGATSSVMRGLMLHGQAKWAANKQHLEKIPGTEGLLDILKPLGPNLNNFFGWMIGNRAARLMKEGRENNFTPEDIKALQGLNKGHEAEFRKAALAYAQFKRSVLDIAEQAGLLDPDARAVWDNADYIPFYREIDDKAVFGATGKKGLSGQSSGIRTLKGGEAGLNDPMENILMNFSRLIDASLKNSALAKTIDTLRNAGSDIVHKVGYDMNKQVVPAAQVRKLLQAAGTPDQVLDIIPPEAFDGMAKMWAIQAPTDPDVVRIMVDGKPQFYKVNDPLLLKSLTSFVPFDFPGLGLARAFKRLLTRTITMTPEFMLRNFIRDSVASQMITRDWFSPHKSLTGIVKSYNESGAFEDLLFAGASFQSGNINAADPEGTSNAMRRALRKKGFDASSANAFVASIVDTPIKAWEKYRHIGEAIENANREAVYEAAIKANKGQTAAAFESKDLMDFSLRGSSPIYQLLTDVVPFLNARVQGMYRLGRADPKRLIAYGMLMAAASLALALANGDNDDYDKLPDWDKETYWHFWIKGEHFRIPKPFELGAVFASVPERILRYALKNDSLNDFVSKTIGADRKLDTDTGKKLVDRLQAIISDQLSFGDALPWRWQIVKPVHEVIFNHDTFRDRPIENQGDEGKLPSQRFSKITSPTAVAAVDAISPLADKIGLSPKKLEHLVYGYLGTAGMYALGVSDIAVRAMKNEPPRPALRTDELPLVRAFYRQEPAVATVYESELYKMRTEVEQVYKSVKALRKDDKEEAADALEAKNEKLLEARKVVERGAKKLAKLNRERDAIYNDRDMTPQEKRKALDELLVERADVAKETMKSEAVVNAQ